MLKDFSPNQAREWAQVQGLTFEFEPQLFQAYIASLPNWDGLQSALIADLQQPNSLFKPLLTEGKSEIVQLAIRQKSLSLLKDAFQGITPNLTPEQLGQVTTLLSANNFAL